MEEFKNKSQIVAANITAGLKDQSVFDTLLKGFTFPSKKTSLEVFNEGVEAEYYTAYEKSTIESFLASIQANSNSDINKGIEEVKRLRELIVVDAGGEEKTFFISINSDYSEKGVDLIKAQTNKAKLVQKIITDKNGHKKTVWVLADQHHTERMSAKGGIHIEHPHYKVGDRVNFETRDGMKEGIVNNIKANKHHTGYASIKDSEGKIFDIDINKVTKSPNQAIKLQGLMVRQKEPTNRNTSPAHAKSNPKSEKKSNENKPARRKEGNNNNITFSQDRTDTHRYLIDIKDSAGNIYTTDYTDFEGVKAIIDKEDRKNIRSITEYKTSSNQGDDVPISGFNEKLKESKKSVIANKMEDAKPEKDSVFFHHSNPAIVTKVENGKIIEFKRFGTNGNKYGIQTFNGKGESKGWKTIGDGVFGKVKLKQFVEKNHPQLLSLMENPIESVKTVPGNDEKMNEEEFNKWKKEQIIQEYPPGKYM